MPNKTINLVVLAVKTLHGNTRKTTVERKGA